MTLLIALVACGGTTDSAGTTTTPAFSEVQAIFNLQCAQAGCHGGPEASTGLDLTDGVAHGQLVDVASAQSSLMRVAPGSREDSYLWHKMNNTQTTVGGSGTSMPVGFILAQDDLDLIGAWIDEGANP